MKTIMNINNIEKEIIFEPHEYLLDVLRRYDYASVRRGCDTNSCSVCTILIDDKPVQSCSFFAARVGEHKITTVEGVQDEAKKIGELLISEGVDQCGYCSPAFVMTLMGLKREFENPTDDDILDYFMGNLCRCSGYVGQLKAIKLFLEVENESNK